MIKLDTRSVGEKCHWYLMLTGEYLYYILEYNALNGKTEFLSSQKTASTLLLYKPYPECLFNFLVLWPLT